MTSPAHLYKRVRAGLNAVSRDPLSHWRFAVPRLKRAVAMFAGVNPIDELAAPACNKGTKTETQASLGLHLAQKRDFMDGVALPRWRGPVEVVQLVLDYKQQLLSVQPAYQRLLGQWPHHITKQGEAFSTIRVMPVGGRVLDTSDWSVIHFMSEKNLTTGVGVRGDAILFDEPPPIAILRELRKAAHAGRRMIMGVFFTPTIRRQWAPLREDYGDTPRRSLVRLDQERAVVRWSLDEVADWVLSPEEKAALRRKYATDPLREAREHGDYAITEGACPFNMKGESPTMLERMLKECREPIEVVNWEITQVDGVTGQKRKRSFPVKVWKHAEVNKSYWVTIDPSSGTDDNLHDPFELQVTEDGTGDLVASSGGYMSGYLVGVLAVGIARQYNSAVIDIEVNDRWGVNVVQGVNACHYGYFATERRELKPGEWADEIGFHNNEKTRPLIIGACQAWIDARRAGVRYGECPDKATIETLMDCILDENGKIVGAPGVHDERLIVRGQALRRAVRRAGLDIPDAEPPFETREQALIKKIIGKRRVEDVEVIDVATPVERPNV